MELVALLRLAELDPHLAIKPKVISRQSTPSI